LDLNNNDDESSISTRTRKSHDDIMVKMVESFDKHSTTMKDSYQQISRNEKSMLEEVSTYNKTIDVCKRKLEGGVLDGEVKENVKFELRIARKMLKKAKKKLVRIYGEDNSESESDSD